MSRNNLAVLALLVAAGCGGGDVAAPPAANLSAGTGAAVSRSADESKMIQVPFEKWITVSPAMAGNADGILGAFTGTILQRVVSADGQTVHLRARYVIDNPHRRGHSFTAVIEGDQNQLTKTAVLTGVVTEGWKTGAPVLVNYNVLSPCTLATAPAGTPTCFQGIIRIGHPGEADEEGEQ